MYTNYRVYKMFYLGRNFAHGIHWTLNQKHKTFEALET